MEAKFRRVEEKEGLVFKKTVHVLYLTVNLTQEEIDFLERSGVKDHILIKYTYKGAELNQTVSSLIYRAKKGSEGRLVFENTAERNDAEREIVEGLEGLNRHLSTRHSAEGERSIKF